MTGPIVLIIIAAIIGANAKDGLFESMAGAYLRYASPPQQRVMVLLFGASFLWAACTLQPVSRNWVWDIFFLALAAGCAYAAGPREMLVDRARQTYAVKSGWPLAQNVRNGSFDDMAGLRITFVATGYTSTYQLTLHWKTKQAAVLLGKFGKRDRAQAGAAHVLNAWGISLPVELSGGLK